MHRKLIGVEGGVDSWGISVEARPRRSVCSEEAVKRPPESEALRNGNQLVPSASIQLAISFSKLYTTIST